jgi:hypothetical protein
MKLYSLAAAATLSLSCSVHSAPLVRIYDLTIDITQQKRFNAVGVHNLETCPRIMSVLS